VSEITFISLELEHCCEFLSIKYSSVISVSIPVSSSRGFCGLMQLYLNLRNTLLTNVCLVCY